MRNLISWAKAAILTDNARGTVAAQHRFVSHGDGSDCCDGCDAAAEPTRLAALNAAADELAKERNQ